MFSRTFEFLGELILLFLAGVLAAVLGIIVAYASSSAALELLGLT